MSHQTTRPMALSKRAKLMKIFAVVGRRDWRFERTAGGPRKKSFDF